MFHAEMLAAEKRESTDRVVALRQARAAHRREHRRARRRAWQQLLESIPPGIAVRLGG
ncbi:hypothetical protein GCM10022200_09680 [Microbacterium awajiense]|uniref:Uncharacterized protein n=1 Tax=Microbacterium awajiense TaxID=415214 RepID=A0ABP7AC52_9MICO